jgi:hypothetical protein
MGAQIGLGVLLVAVVYIGTVAGFLTAPHLAVAATVVLFALIPALKVFVGDWVGSVKDLVVIGAVSAGILLFVFERRRPDRWVLGLVGLLVGLYVVNAGGGHGIAWAQGVRLSGEPLLLLLVGLTLPDPRRTFRWALGALVATACLVAAYGLLQQRLGGATLVSLGYTFTSQVRTVGPYLRSFGTFDDAFAYAAFLLFGLAAIMFWLRRGPIAWAATALVLLGLLASFVRTGALVLLALVGLLLGRRGYVPSGTLLVAAAAVAGGLVLGNPGGSETKTYSVQTSRGTQTQTRQTGNLLLNGRISAWEAALGKDPREWLFGRGVGTVGTAAERAKYTIAPPTTGSGDKGGPPSQAVDSGYLATIADVGIAGLVVLLVLFGRLLVLASRAAAWNSDAGWVALAFLVCIMMDALTRASFTGFPTAFLGMLLVGIALSAAAADAADTELPAAGAAR